MRHFRGLSLTIISTIAGCAFAAAPSMYYSSASGYYGKNLIEALSDIIEDHTQLSYSGVWTAYQTTDLDENGKVWDMYSTKRWTYKKEQCGSYSSIGDCYNREHSFPKSWFDDGYPMYTDLNHLYPTDGYVNNQRGNLPFGECANGSYVASSGSVKPLGRRGASTFSGYSGTVFEPDDEYKGDFARAYFYMATCYNDVNSRWKSDMLAGNSYPFFTTWAVNLLLKWHRQDPVSDKEIKRNDAVYEVQGNRNPFIDHPDLVEHIWGDKKTTGWSVNVSQSPELTLPVEGYALDLGATVAGHSVSAPVTIKGLALEGNVSLAASGNGFSVSPASLSSSAVCSTDGAVATVTYDASASGKASGQLTIKAGDITRTVALSATVSTSLPAGPVTAVNDEMFVATWSYIGDADAQGKYTLDVRTANTSLAGYPRKVDAANASFTVTDLEPSTTYVYTVSSQNLVSEPVSVTTLAPQTSIELLFDGELSFIATSGTPSDVAELLVETKNISGTIDVKVTEPFEVSTDKHSWATTTSLALDEDRFYLRVNASQPGNYMSSIVVSCGSYSNDDAECFATVTNESGFTEDFSTDDPQGTYNTHDQQCRYLWRFSNAGMWDNEGVTGQGVRMGKNSDSMIEMLENYPYGFGVVTLYTRMWSAKEGACTYELEYSADNGSTWKSAGTGNVTTTDYAAQNFTVNVAGEARLRVRQTSGARFLIDDIEASKYSMLVPDFAADYHSWDAYCLNGMLVIESSSDIDIKIYALDGTEIAHEPISAGTVSIDLPAGLYIVAADNFARRVVVK